MARTIREIGVCNLFEARDKAREHKACRVNNAELYISEDGVIVVGVPNNWKKYLMGETDIIPGIV